MIKLLILDLDGTLVEYPDSRFQSSWDALGRAAGKSKIFKENLERYYPYPKKWPQWAREDVAILKGISVEETKTKLFPIPYKRGALDILPKLNGLEIGILSGGVSIVADKVKEDLSLSFAIANKLAIQDGIFTGKIDRFVNPWLKEETFLEIIRSYGLILEEAAYVGDHESDIPIFDLLNKSKGLSIALDPKTKETENAALYSIPDFYSLPLVINDFNHTKTNLL